MQSLQRRAMSSVYALIGIAALAFVSTLSAQTAEPAASAPAASQSADPAEPAEAPRRTRRRAQDAAVTPPADAAAPAPAEKAADAELVCKSVRPAGTRLPQRVCHTQADWDSLTEASQEDMRRVRDRSRASGAAPR